MLHEGTLEFKRIISSKEFAILLLVALIIFVSVVTVEQHKLAQFSFIYKDYETKYFSFGVYFLKYKNITLEYDFLIRLFGFEYRKTNVNGHAFIHDWIVN